MKDIPCLEIYLSEHVCLATLMRNIGSVDPCGCVRKVDMTSTSDRVSMHTDRYEMVRSVTGSIFIFLKQDCQ